jgi:hypothetical protein
LFKALFPFAPSAGPSSGRRIEGQLAFIDTLYQGEGWGEVARARRAAPLSETAPRRARTNPSPNANIHHEPDRDAGAIAQPSSAIRSGVCVAVAGGGVGVAGGTRVGVGIGLGVCVGRGVANCEATSVGVREAIGVGVIVGVDVRVNAQTGSGSETSQLPDSQSLSSPQISVGTASGWQVPGATDR